MRFGDEFTHRALKGRVCGTCQSKPGVVCDWCGNGMGGYEPPRDDPRWKFRPAPFAHEGGEG